MRVMKRVGAGIEKKIDNRRRITVRREKRKKKSVFE